MSPFPRPAYGPLTRYAPDRRPIEVDLSDNTNRWGAHPAALRLMRSVTDEDLTRYPDVYAERLREAIARRHGVPVECVTTGCGSDDLLDSTFRAAGEPGEAVAYLPPTFSMVEIFARMNGMEPRPAPPGSEDPAALLDGSPAVIYVCRPNNPTGGSFSRSWIEALLEAAGPEGPIVLIDEAYADFAGDHFLLEASESSRAVVVRTLSKAYGLAGLRVGYAVGPPNVILEVEKSRGPYKVSRIAERAAIEVLGDEGDWVPSVIAEVKEGRARLESELRQRGFEPLPSQANFVLLPLPGGSAAETTALLRERGVAVRPFPALPGIGEAVRVSVGPAAELDRFLAALDDTLS